MGGCLKRLGVGCGGLLLLAALALAVTYAAGEARLRRRYAVPAEALELPTDEEALARGQRLVSLARCRDCHGYNLAGQIMDDNAVVGRFVAGNLTAGAGGVGRFFSDEDWERALRHGVHPDGRTLVITPAQYYYYMSDADIAAMIAYLKSVRPVDKELPANSVGPVGRLIMLLPDTDWLPAEKIAHEQPHPPAPEPGVTAEYGAYLARIGNCAVCHYEVRSKTLAGWTEEEFLRAMRTGLSPTGLLDRNTMPIGILTEAELKALWLYLQTLPVE